MDVPIVAVPAKRMNKKKIITKTVALKKSEQNNVLTDLCGICLDIHYKIDSITCECKHQFGAACFDGWKQKCIQDDKIVNCPSCRVNIQKIVSYRNRNKKGGLIQTLSSKTPEFNIEASYTTTPLLQNIGTVDTVNVDMIVI
jgi:hypothetical protein